MKKIILLLLLISAFSINNSFSQEIKKTLPPIYDDGNHIIQPMSEGKILLIFQDTNYEYIVKLGSLKFSSKEEAILYFEKIAELLNQPKTSKNENLTVEMNKTNMSRLGFDQRKVFIRTIKGETEFNIKEAKKIINSLKQF